MNPLLIALLIGLLGGLVAALCGVGGGIIMVPAFAFALGLDQKQAVATSLAVIVPTALVAAGQYARVGLIDWKIAAAAAAGAVVAAALGAEWMKTMGNQTLTRIFAITLILVGCKMLFTKP